MKDLTKGLDAFAKVEPITKGLSKDQKYCVTAQDGTCMLLRISDISELQRKKSEYDMMERVYTLGPITSKPLGFGLCNDGKSCYSLSSWIDGEDAEKILPLMSETEQYRLGLRSGEILRKIHSLPAPESMEAWSARFRKKLNKWIDEYNSKPEIHSDIGKMILRYLEEHSLAPRPQAFIHGDYNTENIMVMANGDVNVIDFNCYNTAYGDPWWDLNNMAWMPVMYPHFYTGQINGYFKHDTPSEFWDVLRYYLAYEALAALTDSYGLNGIEDGAVIVNNIMRWTNNFKSPVPEWYLENWSAVKLKLF